MKKISLLTLFALLSVFTIQVFAQDATPSPTPTQIHESLKICQDAMGSPKACDNKDTFDFLLASLGGMKGMGALAIAFLLSKLLLMLILSPLFSQFFPSILRGDVKLTVAMGLNIVVGILALMAPPVSLPFSAAITHSSVLALASVFANQAYKQYLTPKGSV